MLEGADEEAFEGCPGARIIEPREHVFFFFSSTRGPHCSECGIWFAYFIYCKVLTPNLLVREVL